MKVDVQKQLLRLPKRISALDALHKKVLLGTYLFELAQTCNALLELINTKIALQLIIL